ncbi:MAG: hypothetical protein ACLR0P_12280 [Oscillospiraceae bacterium]
MISVTMLASSIARRLPQIPLEQCKSLLAEFRDQVRAYGLGERLWQCHAGEFAMMTGDLTALEEHLERFRAAERDDVSDCAVCETGAMAEYLLALGRRTEELSLWWRTFCKRRSSARSSPGSSYPSSPMTRWIGTISRRRSVFLPPW